MTIELVDLRFQYAKPSAQPLLHIPAWSLASGERVFIHGPSGGGKSTLLNILGGLLLPDTGQVSVMGQPLDKMSGRQRDRFRAKHIGYVFQQFNLIPYLNAVDNISLADQFSRRKRGSVLRTEINTLLSALNISASDRRRSTRELSMGQQQRVAIARALINNPDILIVDEPTSSLDQNNRDGFMSILMSLVIRHQITLVFVSHDFSLAQYFDRVESLSDLNQVKGAASC